MSNELIVKHSSIIVPNYERGDNEPIEKMLSVWNDAYYRFDEIGFYYDEEKKELRLPRGLDIGYLERSFQRTAKMDFNHDEFDKASYRLMVEPRSDIQRKSISYLLGVGDFEYTKKHSQLTLNLDTGDGKTYCVIAALTFMKRKSMIITHTDNIKQQWVNSIKKMTDMDEKFIFNIEGSSAIKKLMKLDKLPFKTYVVNHGTLRSYAKRNGWESIDALFKKLRIGVKVFDEAHLEFENLLKTDLHTNTKSTIYLTANFERAEHKQNRVFNLCFKNIARYGVQTREEKRKHIIYMPVKFNSRPSLEVQASMKGPHGFSKNKYIDHQIENSMFLDVIGWLVEKFEKYDGKLLLLFSKIDATEHMNEYLQNRVPHKSIGVFNSKIKGSERDEALLKDIIISTPKSMGTGTDVPGLRVVIMTEPYTSPITANQTSGRLREYGEDKHTLYIELIDTGFKDVSKMAKKRMPIFKKKCSHILDLKYPGNN